MNRLLLLRHAKTETSAAGGDHARALTERGRDDAALIAQALAQRGWVPDRVLVSDATRARQTWDAIADIAPDAEIRPEPRLYDAQPETIDRCIADAADGASCLMVVGHNPGLHLLASDYLARSAAAPPMLDCLAAGLPTGAVVAFAIDGTGRRSFEALITPQALGGGGE